jgi:hypothetical protein
MNLLNIFVKWKIVLLLAICYLLLAIFPRPAYGFATPQQSYQTTFERAVFKTDEMNLESFVFATLKAIPASIQANVFCLSCTTEERQKNPSFVQDAGQMLASLYSNPPASSTQYLAYLGDKVGLVKPAYAQEQSMGFQMNLPILPVWAAMRDVAYGLSVILFVVMGFAIMFKVKVDPKTVITIQLALPKIIVGLLLITFSYAIAGLVMDFMYLLMLYVTNLFVGSSPNYNGIFTSIKMDVGGASFSEGYKNLMIALNSKLQGTPLGNGPASTMVSSAVFIFMATVAGLLAAVMMGPVGIILGIIVLILVLVAIFRLAMTIIKAYCQLIIGVITAPLQILVGMLPGSGSVTGWLKNIITNALVFPATIFMLCLGSYLILTSVSGYYMKFLKDANFLSIFFNWIGIGTTVQTMNLSWSALTDPIDYYQTVSMIFMSFAGLGVIMLAPNVADLIQSYVTAKAFDYGKALGEATDIPVYRDYKKSFDKQMAEKRDSQVQKAMFGKKPASSTEQSLGRIERGTAVSNLRARGVANPGNDDIESELSSYDPPR